MVPSAFGPQSKRSDRSGKTVLFCPTCGRKRPAEGDWNVTESSDGVAYTCPACDALVVRQPNV